uniref:Uncharacterized protein n=1 Tax=Anguilla anguilla TaxID=7936 RepID=A0A0E9T0J6_ANGAN
MQVNEDCFHFIAYIFVPAVVLSFGIAINTAMFGMFLT